MVEEMNVTREANNLRFEIEEKQAGQSIRDFLMTYHLARKKIHVKKGTTKCSDC